MKRTAHVLLTLGAFLGSAAAGHAGGRAAVEVSPSLATLGETSRVPAVKAPASPPAVASAAPIGASLRTVWRGRGHGMSRLAAARERTKARRTEIASARHDLSVAPTRPEIALAQPAETTVVEKAAPGPTASSEAPSGPREAPSPTLVEMLARHAHENGVPLALAQAVVRIESRGNARASHGGALGLMQIKPGTARAAGFSGGAGGLFDPEINLRYGMKVLGAAYKTAGGDVCRALMQYQSGHLATHMSRANRVYCSKARAIMAGA